ncbi:MAG: menaquinone biosynthesis protein [Candidatus Auribacterota bacterium]
MYRIGIIQYINSIPFSYGLEQYFHVQKDTPRNLALHLMNNEFDAAFIPVVEYLRNKDIYTLVDGVSISSFGPTNSVFIACKTTICDIRIIQESPASLSSNFISRIMLKEIYGITPLFIDHDHAADIDARIIIGDDALAIDKSSFIKVLDVGEEWNSLTGLPMVYAVCVTKQPVLAKQIGTLLKERCRANLADLDAILVSLNKQKYRTYLNSLNYSLTHMHLESINTINGFIEEEYKLCPEKC